MSKVKAKTVTVKAKVKRRRLADLRPEVVARLAAYERCNRLGERPAGERAAAAAELADELLTMTTAVRQFCGRQFLAVEAAAVVIQPAGGLPPVIIPMAEAGAGDPLPACVVPPAYHFLGRTPPGH